MRNLTRLTAVAALIAAVVLSITVRPAAAADGTDPYAPSAVEPVPSWIAPGIVEPPIRFRKSPRVTYAEQVVGTPFLWAEFNDGRVVILRPCKVEDGRRCWWDAANRGNGIGTSFVSYGGRLTFIDLGAPYGIANV